MAQLDLLIKAWKSAHWEMGEAFKGLPDEDLWKRPAPRLLSVGELACHVAYWDALSVLGEGTLESPLFVQASDYYTTNADEPFVLLLGSEAVYAELTRIHEACLAWLSQNPQDSESPNPHRAGWKWGGIMEYRSFHAAYHTGQMYSVRHLLGHKTEDN